MSARGSLSWWVNWTRDRCLYYQVQLDFKILDYNYGPDHLLVQKGWLQHQVPETHMAIPISLLAIISFNVLFVVKLLTIELLLSESVDDVNLLAKIGGINLHMSQSVSDFDCLFWQYYRSGLKYVWPLWFCVVNIMSLKLPTTVEWVITWCKM